MMLLETIVIVFFLSPLNKGSFLKLPFCGNVSKFDWLIKELLIECNTNLLLFTNLCNLNTYLLANKIVVSNSISFLKSF